MESTDEVENTTYKLVAPDKSWGDWVDLVLRMPRAWGWRWAGGGFEDANEKVVEMTDHRAQANKGGGLR